MNDYEAFKLRKVGIGFYLNEYLINNKISQTEFASMLGITQKHLNSIINGNANISEELMIAISLLTDIDANLINLMEGKKYIVKFLTEKFDNMKDIKNFLNSFNIKEMNERKWLTLHMEGDPASDAYDLTNFLKVRNFDIYDIYSKEKIYYKKRTDADLKKVFLWIRRCEYLTDGIQVDKYDSHLFDQLINELKIESNKKFDIKSIIKILNKYGIVLCVEEPLKGTKIRGCSMVKITTPYIFISSTSNKEKSSFYFTLFHELSHIKTDFNKAKSKIFTNDDYNSDDKQDIFALNTMINSNIWNEIVNDYNKKDEICKKNNIPLCFLYTRLAYEGKIKYTSKEYKEHIEVIDL